MFVKTFFFFFLKYESAPYCFFFFFSFSPFFPFGICLISLLSLLFWIFWKKKKKKRQKTLATTVKRKFILDMGCVIYSSNVNDDQVKPRSLRFTWSMKTTSSRDPNEIMMEIRKVFTLPHINKSRHSNTHKKAVVESIWTFFFFFRFLPFFLIFGIGLVFLNFIYFFLIKFFFFGFVWTSFFPIDFYIFGSCPLIRNDWPHCPLLIIRPRMLTFSPFLKFPYNFFFPCFCFWFTFFF